MQRAAVALLIVLAIVVIGVWPRIGIAVLGVAATALVCLSLIRRPKLAVGGGKPPPKKVTELSEGAAAPVSIRRGEEIDTAAAQPSADLVRLLNRRDEPLPAQSHTFDLREGRVVLTPPRDGLYLGASNRADNPGRSTLLTPQNIERAAWSTSGRIYAWWVLDSPEARYAVRASPRGGRAVDLDSDDLVAWLRPRLRGSPPHKLPLSEYLEYLRGLGLTVVASKDVGVDAEVRFDLVDVSTAAERKAMTRKLTALNEADFAALDWSAYDATVGRAACNIEAETAGDVSIDLDAQTVAAPKTRTGLLWASVPHSRSYVTFHTHPAARFRGEVHEPPSDGDLRHVLSNATHSGLIWHFVTAPEGTYIVRPSQLLIARFVADHQATMTQVLDAYASRQCVGGVAECAVRTVDALRDAGFVAYFHAAPCMKLSTTPNLAPYPNSANRQEAAVELKAHRELKGDVLLAADWGRVLEAAHTAAFRDAAWVRARFSDGEVRPIDGHSFGDPAVADSYPMGALGPLMVFCVDDAAFPTGLPAAAVAAAQKKTGEWAWMAFLSTKRVIIFRADATGALESHGPRHFAGSVEGAPQA